MQVEDSLVHWHPCVYCLGRNPLRLKLELAATAMGSGVVPKEVRWKKFGPIPDRSERQTSTTGCERAKRIPFPPA